MNFLVGFLFLSKMGLLLDNNKIQTYTRVISCAFPITIASDRSSIFCWTLNIQIQQSNPWFYYLLISVRHQDFDTKRKAPPKRKKGESPSKNKNLPKGKENVNIFVLMLFIFTWQKGRYQQNIFMKCSNHMLCIYFVGNQCIVKYILNRRV